MRYLTAILSLLVIMPVFAAKVDLNLPTQIEVENAWAKPSSKGSHSALVFMTLINRTGIHDALVKVTTPVARKVIINRTYYHPNGMVEMEEMGKIILMDNTKVQLEAGDVHLMLMGLNNVIRPDIEFPLTLEFASGKMQNIKVTVKSNHGKKGE